MDITIKDIAKMANVSCTTVSRVLNNKPDVKEDTRKKVLQIIEENNFQPNAFAQAISSKRSNCVALVIPYSVNFILLNSFYDEIIRGISSELTKKGYFLLFCYSQDENYVASIYTQKRADGFILLSPGKNSKGTIKFLKEVEVPFVSTTRVDFDESVTHVDIDNHYAASIAVEYLISLGHKKVAFIKNGAGIIANSKERFRGYKDALLKHNIDINQSVIEVGDISMDGGYKAMRELLQKGAEFTAVFVASDIMAIGAMKAIHESGKKIPQDISIVGFDDIPAAQYAYPPLTTIRQSAYDKGKKAASLLIKLLEKKNNVKSILLDVNLIERESSGYQK